MMSYTIEEHLHGLVVRGQGIPINDLLPLMERAKEAGYDIAAYDMGPLLGGDVIMVITTKEGRRRWKKELEAAQ